MNILEIRRFLESQARIPHSLSDNFHYDFDRDSDRVRAELELVTHRRYLPALSALIQQLAPRRLLTIGALYGTLESYVLQCCDGHRFLQSITICDLDIADYNPNRDNGSIVYRNICGTKYGGFQKTFTLIRGNSRWPDVVRKIFGCGPYDLVFIDGEHSYEAVYSDLSLAEDVLDSHGTVLVHDTSLFDSSVPQGWDQWAKDHHPQWVCDAVGEDVFFLGLGFAQRS